MAWKKQTVHPDCERINCPAHDPIRDFKMEPTGAYVLIRIDTEKCVIETAVCDAAHRIRAVFSGKKCEDIYHTLFRHEHRLGPWLTEKDHIAYLGKELKKAELALEHGSNYLQE